MTNKKKELVLQLRQVALVFAFLHMNRHTTNAHLALA